jgi:phosphoribosylanthranilate isomerase
MFTTEELGFVSTTCWTVTPEDPATWVELAGGLEPWEAVTVTTVGVPLGVLDAVNVGVEVELGVLVAVLVAVLTPKVLVLVAVGVEVTDMVTVYVAVFV